MPSTPEFQIDPWILARSIPEGEPLIQALEQKGKVDERITFPDWTGRPGVVIPAKGIATITFFLRGPSFDERRGLMLDIYPYSHEAVVKHLDEESRLKRDTQRYIFRIERGYNNLKLFKQTFEDHTVPGRGLTEGSVEHFWACEFYQLYQNLDDKYFQRILQLRPVNTVESLLREVFPNGIEL